jgi:hypothetical protein
VTIHLTGDVAVLSGHCSHVDCEVFVRYWKLWHICSRLDDPFQSLSSSGGSGISMQG